MTDCDRVVVGLLCTVCGHRDSLAVDRADAVRGSTIGFRCLECGDVTVQRVKRVYGKAAQSDLSEYG